jgi:hypothetical protein
MRGAPLLVAAVAACHGGAGLGGGGGQGSDFAIEAAKVTLHDAGQEPRRVLRYKVSDYSRDVHFTQDDDVEETIKWHCSPCTYRIGHFALSGKEWSGAEKIHGDVTLTDDGRMQFKVAAVNVSITPDPTEYLILFMVPFPVEAVGEGATWSSEVIGTKTDYNLVVLSDATAKVHVDRQFVGATDRHFEGTLNVTFADPVGIGTITQRIMGNDGVELPDPTTFTFD